MTGTISILDTDLYKLTMQQAILHHFPTEVVEYKFYNRRPTDRFTRRSFDWFQTRVRALVDVRLTSTERAWLETKCPYFKKSYLDFLQALELQPAEQVDASFVPDADSRGTGDDETGEVQILVKGKWVETILYEVPLMALLSESYFLYTDKDWNMDGVEEIANAKAQQLISHNIAFSEFGTRRRRSYAVHDLVMQGLIRGDQQVKVDACAGTGRLAGTSNVHFAQKYDLVPVGTIAHEWTMGIAALKGYDSVNARALDLWEAVYPPVPNSPLHIALTDTFSSRIFFNDFTAERASAWRGLRQDSGDPLVYAQQAKNIYDSLGVSLDGKVVVFSDSLDVERCLEIKKFCDSIGLGSSFGVGTFLTNDFPKSSDPSQSSKALNIVIKLSKINEKDCVKISDEITKNTGRKEEVERVKQALSIGV